MGNRHRENSKRQRELRRRRGEQAYIFDRGLSRCWGTANRVEWESSIAMSGGNVATAAAQCGIPGVPNGAIALWGTSAEDALATYRRWMGRSRACAPSHFLPPRSISAIP